MLTALVAPFALAATTMQDPKTPHYPLTRTVDVSVERFGLRAEDPYRWLENDVRVDPEVRACVEAQNKVSHALLASLPQRTAIQSALKRVWNFERYTVPVRRGERLFYRRNSGLQNQFVLYVHRTP
ncbi:MAG: S9 family peptidase, partial [Thermoleophilia bacterium]